MLHVIPQNRRVNFSSMEELHSFLCVFCRLFLGVDPSPVVSDCGSYFAAILNPVSHLFVHMLPTGML